MSALAALPDGQSIASVGDLTLDGAVTLSNAPQFGDASGTRVNLGLLWRMVTRSFILTSPAASGSYYMVPWGGWVVGASALAERVYAPFAVNLQSVRVSQYINGALSSNEQGTIALLKNGGAGVNLFTDWVANAAFITRTANISLALAAGDYVQAKWTTPAWGTPPSNLATIIEMFGTY